MRIMRVSYFVRSLLGPVAVFAAGSGCAVAQHDQALRLSEELGRARAQLAWERTRTAEVEARAGLLESRVARLEQGAREGAIARSAETSQIVERLDRVLDVTEKLSEERDTEPVASVDSHAGRAGLTKGMQATTSSAAGDGDASTAPAAWLRHPQLRALAKLLLTPAGSWQQLSRDEERALRLLLGSERKLDTKNPWANALY